LVIDSAVELTQYHRLRGYDAVQLATAVITRETLQQQQLPSPAFVAADSHLLAAAVAAQLPVANPLEHTALDTQAFSPEPRPERDG
jgi:hypothetical protein